MYAVHNPQHRPHELEVELIACQDEEPEDERAEGEEHRARADQDEVGGDDDVLRRAAVRSVEEEERDGGSDKLQDDHNHDQWPDQEIVPLRNAYTVIRALAAWYKMGQESQDRDYPDVSFSQLTQATFLNGVLVNEHVKCVSPPSPELSSLNDLQFQSGRRANLARQSGRERPSSNHHRRNVGARGRWQSRAHRHRFSTSDAASRGIASKVLPTSDFSAEFDDMCLR
ncbi:hypothetical protein K438DRAFT_1782253 [Mycena galopus ATCC 62051]|nr:hypothetical protein K438DRAFT_1782253 [Mycena galopus ATCC 62051]